MPEVLSETRFGLVVGSQEIGKRDEEGGHGKAEEPEASRERPQKD
jgi:hypothetical protein